MRRNHIITVAILAACGAAIIGFLAGWWNRPETGADPAWALAADEQELVATVRDGHIQAASSIRQLECQMDVKIAQMTMTNPYSGKRETLPTQLQVYSWWEDQGVARCTGRFSGRPEVVFEYLWKDSALKQLKTVLSADKGAESIPVGQYFGSDGINQLPTVWRSALFYRPDEMRDLLTSKKVVSATEEVVRGRRMVKITVNSSDDYREDIFFDPRRNYMIQKRVGYSHPDDPSSYHLEEVSAFTEPKPGILFPAAVDHSIVNKGNTKLLKTTTFRAVRVNEPVDQSKFQLTFPTGTQVTDRRIGKAYTTGADEEPVGQVESIDRPDGQGERTQYPTAMQPRTNWPRVLLWSGICLAVAALVIIAVIRRRRLSRSADIPQSN